MLKFFRRIRRKLLDTGKIRAYLVYAIGEILLVMVGILLALQVNNWSENIKLQKHEISFLKNLRSDLLITRRGLEQCNELDATLVGYINNILDHIRNNKPYHDSLSLQFASLNQWARPVLITSAYENLKSSKGLELISNDSLRQEIVDMHERYYPFIFENLDKEESMIHQELMLPVFAKLFVSNENGEAVPNDYPSLQGHQEFINVLTLTLRYRLLSIDIENRIKVRIDRLIGKVESELVRLKK